MKIPDVDELKQQLNSIAELTLIGRGGFKAVYKGIDTSNRIEAIKAIYIPTEADGFTPAEIEEQIERAKREITALRLCTSQCVVKLGTMEPRLITLTAGTYLTYSEELLPGEKLASYIGRAPKPDYAFLLELFKFLINVIDEMIRIGHLHRDIKPDNIFVTGLLERPFVVLDFGIAYKINGTELTHRATPPRTLRYTAPELLFPGYKEIMNFRCDLYSAGLTVYQIASGVHPFAPRLEEEYATIYRIMHNNPVPLELLRPDLPKGFCKIIDRCFRRNPSLRYSNVNLLKHDLEEV